MKGPMTVEQAVEILIDRSHNGYTGWVADTRLVYPGPNRDFECEELFTHFEAIAIAEKYERDGH